MASKRYKFGTHRVVPPETTLEVVRPVARSLGVTRCADVTGLDCLGIPVYCAIRPRGFILQVANGKGCHQIDAKVSALMEAIEHACIERPVDSPVWSSVADLRRRGCAFVEPAVLQGFDNGTLCADSRLVPWIEGCALHSGSPVLVPAPFVYPIEPRFYAWSTNGLASGNDEEEARLHGLYEVCERHCLSLLTTRDAVLLDGCQAIDTSSIDDSVVAPLVSLVERAGCQLILLHIDLDWKIHTFLAFVLDTALYRGASIVNFGAGAHLSPAVAAVRAITEAAQSRLTFIHGAREDLPRAAFDDRHSRLCEDVRKVVADTAWAALHDSSSSDMTGDYRLVLEELSMFGFDEVISIPVAMPADGIAVVKVAIVGSKLRFSL